MTVFVDEKYSLSDHISYSQVQTYLLCGYQYYLGRVMGNKEEESVWAVGGSAYHKACEVFDLEQIG